MSEKAVSAGNGSISPEIASKEVQKWIEAKRISPRRLKGLEREIESLQECFEDGVLSLNDDNKIVQKLIFPVGEVKELVYDSRMNTGKLNGFLSKAKPGFDSRARAYILALTSQMEAIIDKMDTEDQGAATSIVVFFM